jgi:diguanylate cyclase (GGDEF)-like protein
MHVVVPDDTLGARCDVTAPHQCPVTRHGREAVFTSSDALDSCAFLRDHPAAPCAVCMPVSVAGRALGVIHECHPNGTPPPTHRVHELEIIARKAGERLSMLRAFAASERQAHTDPLTGLYNRRSLQEASARLGRDDLPLSVAFIDLDHFKDINDTYGHDIGDRALRIFAGVLRSTVRPDDIVSLRRRGVRRGAALCDATEAVRVLSRLQTTLADTLHTDSAPPFTISIGVAATIDPMSLDDLIVLADGSLLRAKDLGRNRIVVAGDPTGPIAGPALTITEPVVPVLLGDRPAPEPDDGPRRDDADRTESDPTGPERPT